MVKEQEGNTESATLEEVKTERAATDTPLNEADIQGLMTEAVKKGDWSAVKKLAGELDKLAKAEEKTKKDALQSRLAELTLKVKAVIEKALKPLIDSKELDGADGIWYAQDFGEVSTGCRLVKTQRKATGEGTGAGKSSYVADPRKSADMLSSVGEQVMFAESTEVMIDKEKHIMPAGTTLQKAYDYSTNGGWRNRVRMQILKAMDKS